MCPSTIRRYLRQNTLVARHMTIVARESHYTVRRKILAIQENSYCINTTKYWLCAILKKLILLEYCMQPIFCGIDAITDNY